MMRITSLILAAALALSTGTGALAQQHAEHHAKPEPAAGGAKNALAEGEIRKVDKGAGKVTIKHGPLESLDMPAMTMVFRAGDPAMLEKVKVGDSIRFKAEKIDGVYTVTEYAPAK